MPRPIHRGHDAPLYSGRMPLEKDAQHCRCLCYRGWVAAGDEKEKEAMGSETARHVNLGAAL